MLESGAVALPHRIKPFLSLDDPRLEDLEWLRGSIVFVVESRCAKHRRKKQIFTYRCCQHKCNIVNVCIFDEFFCTIFILLLISAPFRRFRFQLQATFNRERIDLFFSIIHVCLSFIHSMYKKSIHVIHDVNIAPDGVYVGSC